LIIATTMVQTKYMNVNISR